VSAEAPATAAARTDGEAGAEVSILLDVGSAWTKAAVVGRGHGRWRIVAAAAQPTIWGEDELVATLGSRLAEVADRRLRERMTRILSAAPRISCHTPRRPGRLAVGAVSGELSGEALRHAAESAGWTVVESATMDDGRSVAERLRSLQAAEVDAWLLAGGFDEVRPDQALEVAGLVAAARGGSSAPVLWAGSAALRGDVSTLFGSDSVTMVDNARPSADREDPLPLRHVLEDLLQRVVEPGSQRHLAPAAFRRAVAELARSSRRSVLGVDLGARYLTWVLADEEGAESRVFASGGIAGSGFTGPGSAQRVTRSLPHAMDELAVGDTLQNIRARPGTLPQTEDELAIAQAAARLLLTQAAAEEGTLTGIDLIVGAGRTIAGAPRPAHAAQILLDGLRPLGVTQLAIDASGALAPLGALGEEEIAEGLGVLRDDLLTPLGTAVVCRPGRPGQTAMRVTMHRTGWPSIGPVEVRGGGLQVLPLGRGQTAEIEVQLEAGATLGGGRRARSASAVVSGGSVGVIVDARGAPLQLPRRAEDRRAVLSGWRDVILREPL
jgi:MutL protein